MKDWTLSRISPHRAPGVLTVFHREAESHWPETARAYWGGHLDGVETFRCSRDAVVHHGTVNDKVYFFKILSIRSRRFDGLKHVIKKSRGRRALLEGEALREAGFQTPETVCLMEYRRGGMVRGSAIVTEAVEPSENLQAWF
ncbi:MAG: hypothetical protein AAF492_28835, partial [Verrucomicrobiota bacterium]